MDQLTIFDNLHKADSFESYEENKKVNKDHIATPQWVVENIYKIINVNSFSNIWLPFDCYDSEFKLKADELNLKYKATHKLDEAGNDFFITAPPENCELMISNPPFSIQNDIIKRSFDLADSGKVKSFALLLPLSTLETLPRAKMYNAHKNKLSIGIFAKRIKFLGHKDVFNKGCCWICYNIPTLKDPIWWIFNDHRKISRIAKKYRRKECIQKFINYESEGLYMEKIKELINEFNSLKGEIEVKSAKFIRRRGIIRVIYMLPYSTYEHEYVASVVSSIDTIKEDFIDDIKLNAKLMMDTINDITQSISSWDEMIEDNS